MPRIRCHYIDCLYLEDEFCGASAIEIDPEDGCLTFAREDFDVDWADDSVDEWDEDEFESYWLDDDDLDDKEDDEF
jgi:hypothetical protein